ncbi:MAG: hypothetical protein ACI4K7_07585 [Oscillospiraceae bacterium]
MYLPLIAAISGRYINILYVYTSMIRKASSSSTARFPYIVLSRTSIPTIMTARVTKSPVK